MIIDFSQVNKILCKERYDSMENLRDIIQRKLHGDKKLSCSDAFKIAEENGISAAEVGKTCDEMDVKIKGCQLGCF